MINLKTHYLGLPLKNPIIAGASDMTSNLKLLHQLEEVGVGAIVIKSLFEEQVMLEKLMLEEDLEKYNYRNSEMISVLPRVKHAGPQQHIVLVKKAKSELSIPVIASLNAVSMSSWVGWAKQLQDAGADAVELNIYDVPTDYRKDASTIENEQLELIAAVKKELAIPLSVKLSSHYTNPLHFVYRLNSIGVKAVVLFNRFFEPDIDIENQKDIYPFNLSSQSDYRSSLRFVGLLAGNVQMDICASTGIFSGEDVIKLLLVGASSVQIVSTLYKNKISHVQKMLDGITQWMQKKQYDTIDGFRGKLNGDNGKDPWRLARSQYVKLLMKPDDIVNNYTVL